MKNNAVIQAVACMIAMQQVPTECQAEQRMPAWFAAPGLTPESVFPETLISDVRAHGWRQMFSYPDLMYNKRNSSQLIAGAGAFLFPAVLNFDTLLPAIKIAFTSDTENNTIKIRVEITEDRVTQANPVVTTPVTSYWDGLFSKGSGSMSQRYLVYNLWRERFQYNEGAGLPTPLRDLTAASTVIRDATSPDIQVGDITGVNVNVITTNPQLQTSINLITPGTVDFEDYTANFMMGHVNQFLNNLINVNPELITTLDIPTTTTADGTRIVDTKRLARRK